MRAGTISWAVVVLACSSRSEVPQHPATISAPSDAAPLVATADAPPSSDAPPASAPIVDDPADTQAEVYVAKPGLAPARKPLALVRGTPFEVVAAKRSLLAKSEEAGRKIASEYPGSAAHVLLDDEYGADPAQRWTLLDIATKQQTPLPGNIEAANFANRTLVLADAKGIHRLVRLDDGAIVTPQITLPTGTAVQWSLATAETSDVVWVFAKTAANKTFHGRWTNLRDAKVTLTEALPFWPDNVRGELDHIAFDGDARCAHGTVIHPGPRRCVPANTMTNYIGNERWLDEGVVLDAAGTRTRLMLGCRSDAVRVVASDGASSRVLSTCGLDADTVPFEIWSSNARWIWQEKLPPDGANGFVESVPIIPIEHVVDHQTAVTRWIDLERATIYATKPLVPLRSPQRERPDGSRATAPSRHVFASSKGRPREVWHLDFDRGSIELIGTFGKCSSTELVVTDFDGQRALVNCYEHDDGGQPINASVGDPPTYVEIVDLVKRTRTIAKNVVGGKLIPGGAVGTHTVWDRSEKTQQRRGTVPSAPVFTWSLVKLAVP